MSRNNLNKARSTQSEDKVLQPNFVDLSLLVLDHDLNSHIKIS